ncbi:hypothetical protein DSO57_1012932 [Entomophthora muscae]|uniref:Uncharacterized protein n=1 Tax=Entomophthora muscae TaxID=34485 RepID=A0ACC2U412_9FUNG|nr:hypothetical protein DSO57_1012932 [Entomophthora muscae]
MESDLIIIVIYFTIIIIGIAFFVLYYYISERKEVEVRVLERINQQKAIETLVSNVAKQFASLVNLPIRRAQFRQKGLVQVISWLLLLGILGSLGGVIAGSFLDKDNPIDSKKRLKVGAFLYVLCLNLYFIMRQYIYYTKQAFTHSHDARFQALRYTNFNRFEKSWANYMQLAVLGLEFIQLLSFPLQDIIAYLSSQETHEMSSAGAALSLASLLPNISVKFYYVQFWTCMGVVLFSVLVSLAIHLYNDKFIPGISLFWVSHLVPVVHVAYLPILVTFIDSVACLLVDENSSKLGSRSQLLKCSQQDVSLQLYLWLSLLGFTLAYLLLTVFVTSYERKPLEGDIEFKSKGVAFMKNMSLLLTIDFSLTPIEYSRVKGILSVVILTAVVIYSLHSRPCYVSQINFWRTVGYCCILWSALPGAILDPSSLKIVPIILLILGGWVVILLLSLAGRYCAHTNLTIPPSISQDNCPSNPPRESGRLGKPYPTTFSALHMPEYDLNGAGSRAPSTPFVY